MRKKILFTAGGTGGHILPTVSLVNFFEKNYDIVLVSDSRAKKYFKLNKKIKIYTISTDTPYKKNIIQILRAYFKIFISLFESIFIFIKEKPNLVFGLGGYVSFPISFISKIFSCPLVLYENNASIGRANLKLLFVAKKIFVGNDNILNCPNRYLSKIKHTGNVLREEIYRFDNKKTNGMGEKISILVTGGSQGAEIFGQVIPEVIKVLNKKGILKNIHQQCTKNQKIILENFYNENKINNSVFEFDSNIFEKIISSDLVITRSGASTLGELVHLNKPFIAIPFSHAMDNHQMENARYYFERGFCWMIEQQNFNKETLLNLINKIYNSREDYLLKVKKMKENKKIIPFHIIQNEFDKLIK